MDVEPEEAIEVVEGWVGRLPEEWRAFFRLAQARVLLHFQRAALTEQPVDKVAVAKEVVQTFRASGLVEWTLQRTYPWASQIKEGLLDLVIGAYRPWSWVAGYSAGLVWPSLYQTPALLELDRRLTGEDGHEQSIYVKFYRLASRVGVTWAIFSLLPPIVSGYHWALQVSFPPAHAKHLPPSISSWVLDQAVQSFDLPATALGCVQSTIAIYQGFTSHMRLRDKLRRPVRPDPNPGVPQAQIAANQPGEGLYPRLLDPPAGGPRRALGPYLLPLALVFDPLAIPWTSPEVVRQVRAFVPRAQVSDETLQKGLRYVPVMIHHLQRISRISFHFWWVKRRTALNSRLVAVFLGLSTATFLQTM